MRKNVFLFALSITLVLFSCQKENNLVIKEKDGNSFLKNITESEMAMLNSEIEKSYFDDVVNVKNIENIEHIGAYYLVRFKTQKDELKEIAFENFIDEKGNYSFMNSAYKIYCTGPCDCGLEGNGDYVQCKCSDCQMHYVKNNRVQHMTKKKSITESALDLQYDIEKYAVESYKNTVKFDPKNLRINEIIVKDFKKAKTYIINYEDDNKISSSYMIVKRFDKSKEGDIVVDCTGSCDCRERFYPGTGAIECTCSPCSMTVKKLQEMTRI